MITLTFEEAIAMNGMIDGKPIYGITLLPKEISEKERMQEVQKGMQEKEFIIDGKLTDKYMATSNLLERYKKQENYVFINTLRIGMDSEGFHEVIEVKKEELSVYKVSKHTIVKKFIEAAEFLKKDQKKSFFPFEEKDYTKVEFEKDLDSGKWDNMLVVQKHQGREMKQFYCYYFSDSRAYRYDYINNKRVERGAQDFREDLLEILEIEGIEEWQK